MPRIFSKVVDCRVREYWAEGEEDEPFLYEALGPWHVHVDGEEEPKLVSGGGDFDAEALHALTIPPYGKPTTQEGST